MYTLSGLCAAIAGIVVSAQLSASHPANGTAFEMNAIAAVVLGGTSLAGGRGTILGTLIGAFVIGFLADGLVMMGVSEFWQMVIKGIVIIVAVIIDQMQNRMQQKPQWLRKRRRWKVSSPEITPDGAALIRRRSCMTYGPDNAPPSGSGEILFHDGFSLPCRNLIIQFKHHQQPQTNGMENGRNPGN